MVTSAHAVCLLAVGLFLVSCTSESDTTLHGQGRNVFNVKCAQCHAVTPGAGKKIGTNLAGIGSRQSAEWIQAWIQDPQSVKSNATMSRVSLDEQELRAVVAYVSALR